MSKSKTKKPKKSTSNVYDDVVKIEAMVDRIITKNKEKMSKTQPRQLDVERFSLKNKKGDTLYYLRKKSDKKSDENSEILSDKIISEENSPLDSKCLQLSIQTRSELRDKIAYYYARIPREDRIAED